MERVRRYRGERRCIDGVYVAGSRTMLREFREGFFAFVYIFLSLFCEVRMAIAKDGFVV